MSTRSCSARGHCSPDGSRKFAPSWSWDGSSARPRAPGTPGVAVTTTSTVASASPRRAEFVACHADVNPLAVEFVTASRLVAERAADDRTRQQARVNRRLRGLLTAAGVLLVAALIAGGLALRQADRADRSAAEAEAMVKHADARRIGARALATAELDHALLLAIEGVRLDDSPDTRTNLLAVLSAHPGLIAPERTERLVDVAPSPDGELLVREENNRLAIHDASTLEMLVRSEQLPPIRSVGDVEFSPDGQQLAVLHDATGS